MSDNIIQLNEDLIKHDLKDLVRTVFKILDKPKVKNFKLHNLKKDDIIEKSLRQIKKKEHMSCKVRKCLIDNLV